MKRVGMGVADVGKQVLGVYHRKEFKDTPNKPTSSRFIKSIVHFQDGESGLAQRRAAAPKNKDA